MISGVNRPGITNSTLIYNNIIMEDAAKFHFYEI